MIVSSYAPCRLDIAGSPTDVQPFCDLHPGSVLNIAIDRYVRCVYIPNNGLRVIDTNSAMTAIARTSNELPPNYPFGMVKAALARFPQVTNGCFILSSDIHPGSGLGSSSALATALVATVSALCGIDLSRQEIAETAYDVERHFANSLCGRQDCYASALGGINHFRFDGELVHQEALSIDRETISSLAEAFCIASTDAPRDCGEILRDMIVMHNELDDLLFSVMEEHRALAPLAADACIRGDLTLLGNIIDRSWRNQERLPLTVSPPSAQNLLRDLRRSGVLGARLGGVGGGGYAISLVDPCLRSSIRERIKKGGHLIELVTIDWFGVRTTLGSTEKPEILKKGWQNK